MASLFRFSPKSKSTAKTLILFLLGSGSRRAAFTWLRQQKSGLLGNAIKWNFTKFLIDRSGAVHARYAPTTKPENLTSDVADLQGESQ